MASLDFPSNPTNNQTYSLNGVTYYYNAAIGAWLTQLSTMNLSTSSNTQVLFNDAGVANGSPGFTFNKSSNTLSVVNVSSPTGAVSVTSNLDLSLASSSLRIPVGTTAQRPAGANGAIRFNSDTSSLELYNGTSWVNYAPIYLIEYLVVAGGGAGGGGNSISGNGGGGGGAGGYITGDSVVVTPLTAYTVTIGAGGVGVSNSGNVAANGGNTSFGSFATAIGGGGGGASNSSNINLNGAAGGSGGGGGNYNNAGSGGSGTSGQGNSGGTAYASASS